MRFFFVLNSQRRILASAGASLEQWANETRDKLQTQHPFDWFTVESRDITNGRWYCCGETLPVLDTPPSIAGVDMHSTFRQAG